MTQQSKPSWLKQVANIPLTLEIEKTIRLRDNAVTPPSISAAEKKLTSLVLSAVANSMATENNRI